MNPRITLAAFVCLVASCDAGNPGTSSTFRSGEYAGVFFRVSPLALHPVANVSLTLSDGKFSGTTDIGRYPAICPGLFTVADTNIEFKETCVWTADFDWSLILSGTFQFTASGDSLKLIKRRGDMTDIYKLVRKTN